MNVCAYGCMSVCTPFLFVCLCREPPGRTPFCPSGESLPVLPCSASVSHSSDAVTSGHWLTSRVRSCLGFLLGHVSTAGARVPWRYVLANSTLFLSLSPFVNVFVRVCVYMCAFGDCSRVCSKICDLALTANKLGNPGAVALGTMLQHNECIKELHLQGSIAFFMLFHGTASLH